EPQSTCGGTEASFRRLQTSFSAKLAPQWHFKHLSGLLKRHVAPYDSFSILGPNFSQTIGTPVYTQGAHYISVFFCMCIKMRGRVGTNVPTERSNKDGEKSDGVGKVFPLPQFRQTLS